MEPSKQASARRRARWTIGILVLAASAQMAQARVCNQSPQPICSQTYDTVAYATTHNSFAVHGEGIAVANQLYGLTQQLDDGIRAFMLDVYSYQDDLRPLDVYLCHGTCIFGTRALTSSLQEIKDFLDVNPDEVVSIIFESYVHIDELVSRFTSVGLDPYLHVQAVGAPWPTLDEMIDSDQRLVVFSDRVDAVRPGYHYVWSYSFETHFSAAQPSDLNCNRNRGSAANPLFILNHFLTNIGGSPMLAEQVNHNPFFLTRAVQCWAERMHMPNFVTVDYYDIGSTLAVVDEINRSRLTSSTPPPTHTSTPTVTPTTTPTPFVCTSAANPSCATPVRARMKVARAAAGRKLILQWKGDIAGDDLGNPTNITDYALCLYVDGVHAAQLNLPAGAAWRRFDRNGVARRFAYKNKDGTPHGVNKSTVQPGIGKRGKLTLHASGSWLLLPASIEDATEANTLTAQLIVQDGTQCWGADFPGDVVRLP